MNNGTLAVIPARGGSKGVSRKCARNVGGSSLLSRSISSALKSNSVQRVIVSTDDQEFADIAKSKGAEVPFLRPNHLATDTASTIDAVIHLLEELKKREEYIPGYTLLIQPTTPFVSYDDIDEAFSLLNSDNCAAVSVCESEVNPDWMRRMNKEGFIEPVIKLDVPQHTARQAMPLTYRLNGAIYWIRTSVLLEERTFLPEKTVAYVMPVERSVDIDNEFDLKIADFIAHELGL